MTHLTKLRDELAKEFAGDTLAHTKMWGISMAVMQSRKNKAEGFIEGWNALLKVLTEAAGEFDKEAATRDSKEKLDIERLMSHAKEHGYATALRNANFIGARWQFKQNAARIGLVEANYKILEAQLDEARNVRLSCCVKNEEKCKQLEARLADSERIKTISEKFLYEASHDRDGWQKLAGALQDKLSAAEARAKSMTESRDAYATALQDGVFFDKERTNREIEKILEGHK